VRERGEAGKNVPEGMLWSLRQEWGWHIKKNGASCQQKKGAPRGPTDAVTHRRRNPLKTFATEGKARSLPKGGKRGPIWVLFRPDKKHFLLRLKLGYCL